MDYPKDYISSSKDINVGTAFIVMPIKPEFDLTLGLITDVCSSLGIKAQRADDISKQDFIMANILDGIAKSEIVIVDITGNNPNVFYELGIAHTLRSRNSTLIMTRDEDVSKSPFDIRHWSILKYSYDNKAALKAALKERIENSRKCIDSDDFIYQLLKSYTFDKDIINQFILIAKTISTTNFNTMCSILSENIHIDNCNRDSIISINQYLSTIGDYKDGVFIRISWLLKYLTFTADFVLSQYIDTIKNIFLKDWKRESINMGNPYHWNMVANICFKIIEKKHKDKDCAIEWIVKYLGNARMGRIDKVRTKIEDFMLSAQDKDVDSAIVKMLTGSSNSARESAIDICGQKPIYESVDILLQFIQNNESDPHIIRSCINAFARMEVTTAAPLIVEWMKNNRDKWGAKAVSASLMTVAERALTKLDEKSLRQLVAISSE
ncbi:HEAT repeat domain-containing protein [uncultured Alistipes sp.]|uniref:HEAT repeat domain-containing protein n=1 Tax=uncultured Alistipes sp. TaxID=538949 RepID=UPI00272CF4BE|nr:HEAT repeat domain-containing protein [uncultured Alistipes sp.]